MHITCTGLLFFERKKLPDINKEYEIQSVRVPCNSNRLGRGLYLAYGYTAPRIIGFSSIEAHKKGLEATSVPVTFEVYGKDKKAPSMKSLEELAATNVLDFRHLGKPLVKLISEYWERWLKLDPSANEIVDEACKTAPRRHKDLEEYISSHPFFLDHLLEQDEFKHLEVILFHTGISGHGVMVAYLPGIPKNMIGPLIAPSRPRVKLTFPEHLR